MSKKRKTIANLALADKAVLRMWDWSDRMVLEFPVNVLLVREIKRIPGATFDWRDKVWSLPKEYENLVRQIVRKYFPIQGEEDLPPTLRPVREIRQVILEATAGASERNKNKGGIVLGEATSIWDARSDWASVAIDGCYVIWPRTGTLNLTSNGSFQILSLTGGFIEGNHESTQPYRVRYEVKLSTRCGAEWAIKKKRKKSACEASYFFVGEPVIKNEAILATNARFDIEIATPQEEEELNQERSKNSAFDIELAKTIG